MNIGILTFHRAHNYGAVLQAYALSTVLNRYADAKVIDYDPSYFKSMYRYAFNTKNIYTLFIHFLGWVACGRILKKRIRNFDTFIENYLPLSAKHITAIHDIGKKSEKFNVLLTGSDQVFSPSCAFFDKTFFLDVPSAEDALKISYAASFGTSVIPAALQQEYKKRLSSFFRISVREKSGADIIEELGLPAPSVNCDPALLLTGEEWGKIASPAEQEKYVFMYFVGISRKIQSVATDIAKRKGLKVICLACNTSFRCLSGIIGKKFDGEFRNSSSPNEFISLFKNAEYVVTNSFHGTVFSLLFHKPFLVQTVFENGIKNNRAAELLDLLDLTAPVLETNEAVDYMVDWGAVDKKLEAERKRSLDYLTSTLSACQRVIDGKYSL